MTTTLTGPVAARSTATGDFAVAGPPDKFVLTLLIEAMIAALVEAVCYQSALEAQATPDRLYGFDVVKPMLFYIAYAMQLVLALSAGALAMMSLNFKTIDRTYPMRFWFMITAALLMTARSYTLADLHSIKLVDATGPGPFLFFVVAFIGANRNNWPILQKVFAIEAFLMAGLVLFGISKLHVFTRMEAVMVLNSYLNILLWPAAWIALQPLTQSSLFRYLRFGPMLVYSLGSIFVQTRLNFVMILFFLFIYAYVQRRRGRPQAMGWIIWGALVLWVALFTFIFLRDSSAFQKLDHVAGAFYSRLDEDSRTGQLYAFARDVHPGELLLGRGSFAIWNWSGTWWNGGTDLGYLSLLFFGGVPLFLGYVATQVLPSFRLFADDIEDWQFAAAGVAFMFTIRMFSSSYPGENVESYVLLLCTGACICRKPGVQSFVRRPNYRK